MTNSMPPNSLQVPPDPTSSNNPLPLGPVSQPNASSHPVAPVVPPQSKAPFSFKNTFFKKRVTNANTKQAPTKELGNDLSHGILEAIKHTKISLSIMDLLEFKEPRELVISHLIAKRKQQSNAKDKMAQPIPPRRTEEPSPIQVQMALDKAMAYMPKKAIPPFLITLRVVGKNLHNCMMDLGVEANIMPYKVCKALHLPIAESPNIIT